MSCVHKYGKQLRSGEEEGNTFQGFQFFLPEIYAGVWRNFFTSSVLKPVCF